MHPCQAPRIQECKNGKKPSHGFIKLNVDAAFNQATGVVGVGGIFRDSVGVFMGGFQHTFYSIGSARHGELLAVLFGLKIAQDHNFTPLTVESDCLDIVQAATSISPDFSELSFLIEDLHIALQQTSAASFHHVKRTANSVAHLLAREAAAHNYSNLFLVNPPTCVEEAIINDCNNF